MENRCGKSCKPGDKIMINIIILITLFRYFRTSLRRNMTSTHTHTHKHRPATSSKTRRGYEVYFYGIEATTATKSMRCGDLCVIKIDNIKYTKSRQNDYRQHNTTICCLFSVALTKLSGKCSITVRHTDTRTQA